ncbi:MAG TPA: glycogen-binding domain-containing protein [Gemmatimonadales bacterium]
MTRQPTFSPFRYACFPGRAPRPLAWALVALSALRPGAVAAQRVSSTFDLSGVKLRYADTVDAGAATLSPSLTFSWPRGSADVAASLSQFDTGDWAAQGSLVGAVFVPVARWLAGEVAGSTGGSAHQDGTSTGQGLGTARAHVLTPDAGLWIGGGIGRVWDGDLWQGLRHAEAGGWARLGRAALLATVSPTAVGDTTRYTDAQVFVRWTMARLELGGSAGWRFGSRLPAYGGGGTAWGSANAVLWITSRIAVVAGGGSYPVDPTQGFPGGRYASVGLRLSSRQRTPEAGWAGRQARESAEAIARGATDFVVSAAPDGERTLRVRAPSAQRVEISGDFTGWKPIGLAPAGDGWWTVVVPIAPGTYQVSIRLDGGKWLVPPGLMAIIDEFGGAAGLLVIEDTSL